MTGVQYPGAIECISGAPFWPLEPKVEDMHLEDIATGLAMRARWAGQLTRFYSVAEHSVRVMHLLQYWHATPATMQWGLLHDAAEAWLPDVPGPVKDFPEFAGYCAVEARIQQVVLLRFQLDPHAIDFAAVHAADLALRWEEARALKHNPRWARLAAENMAVDVPPHIGRHLGWSWQGAKRRWREAVQDLGLQ